MGAKFDPGGLCWACGGPWHAQEAARITTPRRQERPRRAPGAARSPQGGSQESQGGPPGVGTPNSGGVGSPRPPGPFHVYMYI